MSLESGNNAIDSLIYSSWNSRPGNSVTLFYSFMTKLPSDADKTDANGFAPMNSAQQAAVTNALAQWAAVANITFLKGSGSFGHIVFGTNDQTALDSAAYAYLPTSSSSVSNGVALYLNNQEDSSYDFSVGSYGNSVLLHEIGHTLGLKHPGAYDVLEGEVGGPYLPAATDNTDYTIMSYNESYAWYYNESYASSPMLYDIQAIQYLYGANMFYRTGNDTYRFTDATAPLAIWDAGGYNTFDFSATTGATVIDLNAGGFSSTANFMGNVSIAYGVTVQAAVAGNGGSLIFGNDAGNTITGGTGSDDIWLGAGSDTVNAGGGGDTVHFNGNIGDYLLSLSGTTLLVAGEGNDRLTGVETLDFADGSLTVGRLLAAGSQLLTGTSGNDNYAGALSGAFISAGAGFDTVSYNVSRASVEVAAAGATFTVTAGAGSDTVSGVERLYFSDGAVALDLGGNAGEAYRLYQAAFDRTPDAGGLGFWIGVFDSGAALDTVAAAFVASGEFAARYGVLDDASFVTQLYANVLHRAPDAGGLAFHVGNLANGVSRAAVLGDFSESAENQAAVIGSISDGIAYTPYSG